MRNLRSIDTLRAALFAALGLAPFGCGGSLEVSANGDAGDGGAGDGGIDATPLADASRHFTCEDPTPVVIGGVDTGYDRCKGGTTRRRAVVACPSFLPRAGGGACPLGAQRPGFCNSDADCTKKANGTCDRLDTACVCGYGCVHDSDCEEPGSICVCGDLVGACVRSTCTTSATCGEGLECADYTHDPGCPGRAFTCQTPADECFVDADCTAGTCTARDKPPGRRTCEPRSCAVGRPFLVRNEARLAPTLGRADWRARVAPTLDGIDAGTRARLATEWTCVARMEHASIAAFARFALQLLAVGAPAELVDATHAAMADETRHARLAFGLAGAYAGEAIGPGRLAIDACLDDCELASMIATVVHEGCVGETVAAIEAREALDVARDPVVREVLATIAQDEARHAELAWRTVAWAVGVGGDDVRDAVRAAFADAGRSARAIDDAPLAASDVDLREHGVLSKSARMELRRAAVEHVVLPCARALAVDVRPRCASTRPAVPSP